MTTNTRTSELISTPDLASLIAKVNDPSAPRLWLFDCSCGLPQNRNSKEEFDKLRIKGAGRIDLLEIEGRETDAKFLSEYFEQLSVEWDPISEKTASAITAEIIDPIKDVVVLYDQMGVFSSPFIWFILKCAGFKNLQVLDGGLPKWFIEKRAVETSPSKPHGPRRFDSAASKLKLTIDTNNFASTAEVEAAGNRSMPITVVVDVRPTSVIEAQGRIPNSLHMEAASVMDGPFEYERPEASVVKVDFSSPFDPVVAKSGSEGQMVCGYKVVKSLSDLKKLSDMKVLMVEEVEVISYCNRGYGACAVLFALYLQGKRWRDLKFYAKGFPGWIKEKKPVDLGASGVKGGGSQVCAVSECKTGKWTFGVALVLAVVAVAAFRYTRAKGV
eukprot:GHVN01102213.1.p1 GENE.GHVN01102213.1~~GHVN01102213.1.p1  ORF type:complete len:386 (+),score=72.99 GHVN01102213.1:178-1335(+)